MAYSSAIAYAAQKAAWEIMRLHQGSPTLSIQRDVVTGRDASKGIKGTTTDAGLSGVACAMTDLSISEAAQMGLQWDKGWRTFSVYDLTGGFVPRMTDRVLYPTSATSSTWNITRVSTFASGRVELFCSKEGKA